MLKIKIFILLFYGISTFSYAQSCNCEYNFIWLRNFFEENDAGFKYAIDRKGEEAYKMLNKITLEKVKRITDNNECYSALYNWLTFFRKGHLGLWSENFLENISYPENSESFLNVKLNEFEKYLIKKRAVDYEGIWNLFGSKIGIKKSSDKYFGFIINSGNKNLKQGQTIFKIFEKEGKVKAVFYSDKRKEIPLNSVRLAGGNEYLLMEFILLKRLEPKITTSNPSFSQLNNNTLLFTIPSFEISFKKNIDSLIALNFNRITNTENLIIDLRNNGGGADGSYEKIIPLLYTNPIRETGVQILASQENALRYAEAAESAEQKGFSKDDKKWFLDVRDKLQNNLGKFVSIGDSSVYITRLEKIYTYPKNVAILINGENGSSAEQFLLAARQSKKVKLFGLPTMGELDISNVWPKTSPCNDFKLMYAVSKSLRIPEMVIDDAGIQPDFFIDDSIPKNYWIEFVVKILKGE